MKFSVDIPRCLSHLKRDHRGYPIPFFVPVIDGVPNFKLMDERKQLICIAEKRCPICGNKLNKDFNYVISGPIGYRNKIVTDPPMHKDCAEFSLQACPHMYYERAQRQKLSEEEEARAQEQRLILDKPSEIYLVRISKYQVVRTGKHHALRYVPVSARKYVYEDGILVEEGGK